MARGTHRVVVMRGNVRSMSKAHSRAKCERIADAVRREGFKGHAPDSVAVVPVCGSFMSWARNVGA
jgi:hypothetical protein